MIFFKSMDVLPVYMCVHICMSSALWRPEEDIKSPGTRVTDNFEQPDRGWEIECKSSPKAVSTLNY